MELSSIELSGMHCVFSGPSVTPRATPRGQREGVCPLAGIPRHIPVLWYHPGPSQTGEWPQ